MLSADVAQPKSKRQLAQATRIIARAARAAVSTRRDERAERRAGRPPELRRGNRQLGREGDRPEGCSAGCRCRRSAILVGLIGLVIGFIRGGGAGVIVGVVVCVGSA